MELRKFQDFGGEDAFHSGKLRRILLVKDTKLGDLLLEAKKVAGEDGVLLCREHKSFSLSTALLACHQVKNWDGGIQSVRELKSQKKQTQSPHFLIEIVGTWWHLQ